MVCLDDNYRRNCFDICNLLSNIMESISIFSFTKCIDFIFPYILSFHNQYFTNNLRFTNSILLCTLNDLLYEHCLNILNKYDILCVNVFNYFYKLWDHNKIKNLGLNNIVKTQIIKVSKYLPDKINNYSKCVDILYKIYPAFKNELNNTASNTEILLEPKYSQYKIH